MQLQYNSNRVLCEVKLGGNQLSVFNKTEFQISLFVYNVNLIFRPDPARKLSANLYDIYHCCVYSEKNS